MTYFTPGDPFHPSLPQTLLRPPRLKMSHIVHSAILGRWGVNYPASLDASDSLFGLSRQLRQDLALVGIPKPGEQLDDASAYFNLPPQKLTKTGVYHFFSTRNNDFSNRNQKGRLMVVPGDVGGDAIG